MNEPTNNDIPHRRSVNELHEEIAGILRKLRFSYEAIISIDESQRVVIFNKGAEKIFGYEAREVIGKPIDLLIPERFRWQTDRGVRWGGGLRPWPRSWYRLRKAMKMT